MCLHKSSFATFSFLHIFFDTYFGNLKQNDDPLVWPILLSRICFCKEQCWHDIWMPRGVVCLCPNWAKVIHGVFPLGWRYRISRFLHRPTRSTPVALSYFCCLIAFLITCGVTVSSASNLAGCSRLMFPLLGDLWSERALTHSSEWNPSRYAKLSYSELTICFRPYRWVHKRFNDLKLGYLYVVGPTRLMLSVFLLFVSIFFFLQNISFSIFCIYYIFFFLSFFLSFFLMYFFDIFFFLSFFSYPIY